MHEKKGGLAETILLMAGLAALVSLQLIYQRPAFFDEDDYLSNVALLHQYGFGKNYLTHLAGSAGPLYSMVHFLFEPFTHLQPPYIRLVNTGFLLGATYFSYRTLCVLHFPRPRYALYIMAIPMTYVITGLALTEMPALFFFTAALYLVIRATATTTAIPVFKLITAGCCMGFAIIGRQPYLLTLLAFPFLFISGANYTKNFLALSIVIVFSMALPCYVFAIWNGLVPTIESRLYIDLATAGTAYRPDFFLLCIFYFAISMLLIAPGFFYLPYRRNILLGWSTCLLLITAANCTFRWIELLPAKSLLQKLLTTPRQSSIFSALCGSAVIFLGVYSMACMYKYLRHVQYRKETLFLAASLLLIAISCGKITSGFSSPYAAQAIPLLLLLGRNFYRQSKYNAVRIGIGMVTGLLSLLSYFKG